MRNILSRLERLEAKIMELPFETIEIPYDIDEASKRARLEKHYREGGRREAQIVFLCNYSQYFKVDFYNQLSGSEKAPQPPPYSRDLYDKAAC